MIDASEYVKHGLALIHVPAGTKGPHKKGWNKREYAITDPASASLIKGNLGLAHAYCLPTPTAALDLDDLEKARVWLAERGVDVDALRNAEDAVKISSGRENRDKLLFRLPPGVSPVPTKKITDPETGDTVLEFRCASANGLTVQDVLPPSIHPDTGNPYEWSGKGNWRAIPEIPAPLLAVWQSLLKRSGDKPPVGQGKAAGSAVITLPPETIQHLRSALLSMKADDYDLWINCGMALKSLGDVGRGLWLEWSLTSRKSQDD
jgi:hypothetical protein